MRKFYILNLILVFILMSLTNCASSQTNSSTCTSTEPSGNSSAISDNVDTTVDSTTTVVPETSERETSEPETSESEIPEPEDAVFSVLKFTTAPTFDGVITEAEWGAPTVVFDKNQAQSYEHYNSGHVELSVTLWLRWDETYLYIGATSPEPDGQYCPSKEGDLWNGDTLQVRVDPEGPNATGDKVKPFGSNVINACFAMVTETGVMGKYDFAGVINDPTMPEAQFHYALKDGIGTWEIAIKHSDICAKNPDMLNYIEEGFEYGITVVRLNAAPNQGYNTFLTWGSGICSPHPAEYCAGSNCLVLSDVLAVS